MQTRPCSHLRPVPFSTLCYPSHSRRSRTLRIPRTHTSFLSKVHTFPFPATEFPLPRRTHARLPSPDGGFPESHVKEAELELLGKPSPTPVPSEEEEEVSVAPKPVEMEAALAPFLKFSRARDASEEARVEGEAVAVREPSDGEEKRERELLEKVAVEYYEPRPGDFVVGVVVSGNEQKLDVNVGAAMLGTMLTKEVLPLYGGELAHALCDLGENAEEFMVPGKIGIAKDEEALSWEPAPGRPVVEVGSVLFAEVFGRSLSGRPLLSTRRMFRRVAWHRARQIKQLNKPIKVRITEWNTGGLLTRIEGLRAFLPKAELMNRVNSFTELKKNVGCHIFVCISRIDEDNNDLIISEREAWDILHLQEGTLLEGTVRKIFPFGAQVRIGETNRSGLLHISNISRARVESVSNFLEVNEKVKVLVVKSMFRDKISLSIADLESEPGLFLSNKEKVLAEAEQMAKRYKLKLSSIPAHAHAHAHSRIKSLMIDALPFDDEAILYSNWKWFNFEHDEQDT